jgi:hypothetical protein
MMTRYRLANWVSGGLLSDAINGVKLTAEVAVDHHSLAAKRLQALRDIIEMETPGANATVKRMANRARQAIE